MRLEIMIVTTVIAMTEEKKEVKCKRKRLMNKIPPSNNCYSE